MKKKITLTVLSLFIAVFALHAQSNYVNKVIVVNEGHYDYNNFIQTVPVTVGAYDPSTRIYTVFDTIQNAQFASNVIVDGANIYVAADSQLVRYDANTYQRLGIAIVPGMRKLAVWNNQLLITRGQYNTTYDSYFQVYDKITLGFIYNLPVAAGPKYSTEGLIVKGDTAYVEVNNGFAFEPLIGLVGRVNLASQTYMNEIDLGVGGTNPEGIYSDNDNIYTVNNTDYTTSSVSKLNVSSQSVNTVNLGTISGCGASGFIPGYVMYQVSGGNQMGRFNTSTLTVQDSLMIDRNIYGEATDTINNLIYVGQTDYVTYGKIFIYDFSAALKDSFDVSVSPGDIALDVRSKALGVNEPLQTHTLSCYPNPTHDQLLVVSGNNNNAGDTFVLTDITGREINRINTNLSGFSVDMHTFGAGIYILSSLSDPVEKLKIVKQ